MHQLAARAGEGQVAELIQYDKIEARELGRKSTGLAEATFLLDPVYQIDGVEVAASGTGTSRLAPTRRQSERR